MRVLVATMASDVAEQLTSALRSLGHHAVVAQTFAAAKAHCDESPPPHLIISEIKLGEHNGLHLAVRGQALGIPAIVIGDASFEREAAQLGALWLPSRASTAELQTAISKSFNPAAS